MESPLHHIEIRGPGKPPAGHAPIANFWRVTVTLESSRLEEWEVILPLSEVLEALKSITITESTIEVGHPAFKRESDATQEAD